MAKEKFIFIGLFLVILITDLPKSGASRRNSACSGKTSKSSSTCTKDQFTCFNGKCIPRNYYCDNGNDCGDNSDEAYCNKDYLRSECPENPPFTQCRSSFKCIPNEWLCDGRDDCPTKEDETTEFCNRFSSTDPSASRLKAVQWIYDRTVNESSMERVEAFIHKAAVALSLAETHFSLGMAKDVSIQLLSRLIWKKLSDIPSSDLASFVNAMLVTCLNPRKFHGMDIVEELRKRVDSQNYTNPYVLLTLCNAGETITEMDKKKLLEAFWNNHRDIWTDTQAMVVMALSCARNQPLNDIEEEVMKELTTELKALQSRNGTVQNLQTTALVLQALYSTEPDEDPDNFDEEKALRQIILSQKLDGSFGSFMETYYVLPVLNCRSFVNITSSHCQFSGRDEISALQDLVNRVGPKIRIQYSLWFGAEKDLERTIALRVPSNMSFYSIMEIAAEIDERFRFEYVMKSRKLYINGISGILDDPENGKFWFLYKMEDGNPTPVPQNTVDFIPKDNDHLVMWYRRGSWID